jgi:ADP-ribose pyrophosphatase
MTHAVAIINYASPVEQERISLEKHISTKRIYEGKVLNLRVDAVQIENGTITTREVVEHNGAAAIVPILTNGDVILVRQYRYPIQTDLLEIPAGTLNADENPKDCATRELREETGYSCGEILKIAECFVAPGYSTERIHIFLAKSLTKSKTNMDEDENIKLETVSFSEALNKIRTGEIRDAKSIVGLHAAAGLL